MPQGNKFITAFVSIDSRSKSGTHTRPYQPSFLKMYVETTTPSPSDYGRTWSWASKNALNEASRLDLIQPNWPLNKKRERHRTGLTSVERHQEDSDHLQARQRGNQPWQLDLKLSPPKSWEYKFLLLMLYNLQYFVTSGLANQYKHEADSSKSQRSTMHWKYGSTTFQVQNL